MVATTLRTVARSPSSRTARLKLSGHLTESALASSLEAIENELAQGTDALVIDAREMNGYESKAREAFVRWNERQKGALAAVAVLTDNALWHAAVAAMGFASGQRLRAFRQLEEAETWLAGV